jgi:hypothetical protein
LLLLAALRAFGCLGSGYTREAKYERAGQKSR